MVTSFRFGLLALLIQCLLLPVAIAQSKPSEKTVPFESKTSGFTLSYPDNFEPTMQPQEGLALFLTRKTADTGGTKANLIVTVPADPHGTDDKPLDLETAYKAGVEMIKSGMKDGTVLEEGAAQLGGEAAKYLLFRGHQSDSGTETNLKCIITVHNNHLYEIFGMSEPSGFETVKQSLDETAKTWKWSSGK